MMMFYAIAALIAALLKILTPAAQFERVLQPGSDRVLKTDVADQSDLNQDLRKPDSKPGRQGLNSIAFDQIRRVSSQLRQITDISLNQERSMRMKLLKAATVAASLVAISASAQAVTLFDDGATNGSGVYRPGSSNVTLTFNAGAGGLTGITFELFGAQSVDGFGNCCTDIFTVALNGIDIFSGAFDMGGGGTNGETLNTSFLTWSTVSNGFFLGGSTIFAGDINLLAGSNTLTFGYGPMQDIFIDESWALNNVNVALSTVPLPAALPLMLAAIGGLGVASRRRKRKTA